MRRDEFEQLRERLQQYEKLDAAEDDVLKTQAQLSDAVFGREADYAMYIHIEGKSVSFNDAGITLMQIAEAIAPLLEARRNHFRAQMEKL